MKITTTGILKLLAVLVLHVLMNACTTKVIKPPSKISQPVSTSPTRATIVIDPGHGGTDSGAIGFTGLKEKDLTLDIALRIKRLLNQVMPNVRVILTRSSDKAVGLEERIQIANKNKGDLFISVHINSSDRKEAHGFEVYSLDVASDRHAERLAARENNSLARLDKGVKFILADLRANDNRQESDHLANFISRGLSAQLSKKVEPALIKDRGYNQAIFQVLFVKMPAVLTELFFISNRDQEILLKKPEIREYCARGIVAGAKKYLDDRVLRAQNVAKRPS